MSLAVLFSLFSFSAAAKDLYFICSNGNQIKVEVPFFGKNKLFEKISGVWLRGCIGDSDVITDDTFKCFHVKDANGKHTSYTTFDLKFKEYQMWKVGSVKPIGTLKCKDLE